MSQTTPYNATGRRKTAIAHAWLTEGAGRITINRRGFEEYLPTVQLQNAVLQPFQVTNTMNKFDVNVVTKGGGIHGQVGAIRMAIARALVQVDEASRAQLREFGLLTRDSRMKERKKPGSSRRPQALPVLQALSLAGCEGTGFTISFSGKGVLPAEYSFFVAGEAGCCYD